VNPKIAQKSETPIYERDDRKTPSWGLWGRIYPTSPAPYLSLPVTGRDTARFQAPALPEFTGD